jgi:hypothetical protein
MQMAHAARRERARLLAQRPHLRVYQDQIDHVLQGAGLSANRLAVMGLLLEAKLTELRRELRHLASLVSPDPGR